MCGFVAIVAPEGGPIDAALLTRMTATLAHRGPDDCGYVWIRPADGQNQRSTTELPQSGPLPGLLFGHRRLSILDLSERSRQPMAGDDGSSWLVYNGEIYNYLELKAELAAAGTQFRSAGDAEVLLKAYERWGDDALTRFNGMWAFVLWDGRRQRLVAARDRFGVKPLYCTTVGTAWIFASEVKALLEFPGVEARADDDEVMSFLRHARADCGGETMFRGIRAVPAAALLVLERGRVHERRYWALPPRERAERPANDLIAEFGALLADAVRIRTRADVAVGMMLSGGLDSTSIAALLSGSRREGAHGARTAGGRLPTFSACWPDTPGLDEEPAIRLLSEALDLDSHVIHPSATAVRDLLPGVTYHLEAPFGTPVPAVQFMLMREARRLGTKVVLNGHGSDEILGGYPAAVVPAYLATLVMDGRFGQYAHERRAFAPVWSPGLAQLGMACLTALAGEARRMRLVAALGALPRRGDVLAKTRHEAASRVAGDLTGTRGLSILDGLLWRLFTGVLPTWLRMEDRMSLAHSVESRLPFLDYRLVEFAFRLPAALKIRDGYTKYILRRAMSPLLPPAIAFERHKRQFTVPLADWLQGPWRGWVGDLLLGGAPRAARYLNARTFPARLDAFLRGEHDAVDPSLLWRVLHTELWMREYRL
jgi:asparagine synthase (glutamine-hydrolysing)